MRTLLVAALIGGTFGASSVRADELAVFEACLHLSDIFEDAALVYSDDHNLDQKLDALPRLYFDYRYLVPLVSTAGGDEAKSVLATFATEQPKVIVGNVFAIPIEKDTAQCKLPGQDKHSCSPMFELLAKTKAALSVACVNDYQKAKN